ncbi:hypothetical protein OPT61_g4786 [Boeremia exigua]|uniref:Uncharacterized protein n=1 Tax=Boeremia exigua TaxID=749465 RepID=A0ACC2ICV0_9PLEO|nr:hypothetical protein OPT61_g4786 [Boeremia exigua]
MRENVVKVVIGPDHTEYYVHSGLLKQHSEYFKRALNGNWKESDENTIRLVDVECKTFDIFLEWLYTQWYPPNSQFHDGFDDDDGWIYDWAELERVKACAFGDRFQATEFLKASENALIDVLIRYQNGFPNREVVELAFECLPSSSPVLKALMDSHCYYRKSYYHDSLESEEAEAVERLSGLPERFLIGVAWRCMKLLNNGGEEKALVRCEYHRHGPNEGTGYMCKVPYVQWSWYR